MACAYKCDGCEEFQNGGPLLVVQPTVHDMSEPPEYHFCAWSCVAEYANRRVAARRNA